MTTAWKTPPLSPCRVAAVRRFNRSYTRVIGALQEGLLRSDFSLAEARVLYELAQRDDLTATELGRELELDPGYLSRILQRFERGGLLAREPSPADRRQTLLSLTEAGRDAFAPLDARSREEVAALLARLPDLAQASLVSAMGSIEILLGGSRPTPWLLRQHRPGDIGWVVARHGALYAEEYGFDARFEALVARVAGEFLAQHDPERERCWIAERDGVNVGSVFLVRKSDGKQSYACCWWNRRRAVSASGGASSPNASVSRARPATAGSRYGPTRFWRPPGRSIRRPVSTWWRARHTATLARRWWARTGNCRCSEFRPAVADRPA